ncbi:Nucleoside phosphorylase [Fusarium albosuccineum]|uniref:Nucleoside phosphorylase n=1 Tax=Fusarium albosuccineum TaxID=1237068 RepID=A0A8H4L277_9HYPO|nr:Nucleoside phosphorylase [Fusarium albosuccineum]
MVRPPGGRDDFEIAIVCAIAREYNAVALVLDGFWDDTQYGRAIGDQNTYTTGRIGEFNVVLVLLSGIGKASAASAAASLRSSYPNIELALVTGICGGVPNLDGKRYPDAFETKDTLNGPTKNIRNFLISLETDRAREQLEDRTAFHLETLQGRALGRRQASRRNYQYLGPDNDHLFTASYRHKHHASQLCGVCDVESDGVCDASRKLSCLQLGCDRQLLVPRDRIEEKRRLERIGAKEAQCPYIFIGRIGSGDTVLKSGEDRDRIAAEHDLIAFEMEGAGVWDEVPCIIVKGVCDYADSHKNKDWQDFAAATAACVAKAIVEKYPRTDKPSGPGREEPIFNGPVFHDEVTGSKIVTGIVSTGGTQTLNF